MSPVIASLVLINTISLLSVSVDALSRVFAPVFFGKNKKSVMSGVMWTHVTTQVGGVQGWLDAGLIKGSMWHAKRKSPYTTHYLVHVYSFAFSDCGLADRKSGRHFRVTILQCCQTLFKNIFLRDQCRLTH